MWVYFDQERSLRGKSAECQPAYQAAETREDDEAVEFEPEVEPEPLFFAGQERLKECDFP